MSKEEQKSDKILEDINDIVYWFNSFNFHGQKAKAERVRQFVIQVQAKEARQDDDEDDGYPDPDDAVM